MTHSGLRTSANTVLLNVRIRRSGRLDRYTPFHRLSAHRPQRWRCSRIMTSSRLRSNRAIANPRPAGKGETCRPQRKQQPRLYHNCTVKFLSSSCHQLVLPGDIIVLPTTDPQLRMSFVKAHAVSDTMFLLRPKSGQIVRRGVCTEFVAETNRCTKE